MHVVTMPSPVGELTLAANEHGITAVYFPQHRYGPEPTATRPWVPDDGRSAASGPLRACREQLAAYFDGRLHAFDLPLAAEGTPFQQRVWALLRQIPFGEVTTYGALARQLGQPTATRAVGAANGRNPLSIVVPCHRVVGANGSLTGFGGGIERKRWLLAHEAQVLRKSPAAST